MIRDAIDLSISLHLGAILFHDMIHPEEIFDITKIMNETGYRAKSSFAEDLHKVIPWIQMKIATRGFIMAGQI